MKINKFFYVFSPSTIILIVISIIMLRVDSYLTFHVFTELFCVLTAIMIFLKLLNTPAMQSNNFMVIVAASFIGFSPIIILHTLSYKGMDLFDISNVNHATQYWIIGKYAETLTLFLSLTLKVKRINIWLVFFLTLTISFCLIYCVTSDLFTDCYIEGEGLTSFKVYSEYIVIIVLMLGLSLSQRTSYLFNFKTYGSIVLFIVITILSSFMFTLYQDVQGIMNTLGHVLRMIAYAILLNIYLNTYQSDPLEK